MCDLAEQAQLSRSGLTRMVDRLEREGLLGRCSCEHDARGAYACLTDDGRERLEAARVTHLAVVSEQFFSHFSEAELDLLADMWERIAPCNGAPGRLTRIAERHPSAVPRREGSVGGGSSARLGRLDPGVVGAGARTGNRRSRCTTATRPYRPKASRASRRPSCRAGRRSSR